MTRHPFPVYFGGTTTDMWTADSLEILYAERECVMAIPNEDGTYYAMSLESPLLAAEINQCRFSPKHIYFHTYVTIFQAICRLQEDEKEISAFPEYFHDTFTPLAIGEILRVLLDDWKLTWNDALEILSRCEFDNAEIPWTTPFTEVAAIQPRTAQLIELIGKAITHDSAVSHCVETVFSKLIIHNSAKEQYRYPIGSVTTEQSVKLRLFDGTGLVKHADVLFDGDYCHREVAMNRGLCCTVPMPSNPVALRYSFRITLMDGQTLWLGEVFGKQYSRISVKKCSGFRLTVYRKGFDTPAWFRRSIMYQVFPDRFAPDDSDTAQNGLTYHRKKGRRMDFSPWDKPVKWQPCDDEAGYMPNDFYGGTFKGIESKLPYLKELGIGVLYLNPIVESCSNHRYDTADYNRPDPILGTMEDFEHLVQEAKKLGIQIMLDGVYSHTGADSVYFNRYNTYDTEGAFQSMNSPYYPWYVFSEYPNKYRAWWGFESLPEVDENNPDWQEFVITGENSVVRNWLRKGTCGWRLDVADELPDNILELIRKATKEESPDHVVMGEVWEDAIEKESYGVKRTYALGNALDTVMNYPFRTACLDFLCGHTDAHAMADFLLSQRLHYPKPMYYALMNLLASHDVPRIRTMLAIAPDNPPSERAQQVQRIISAEEDENGAALQKLASALSFFIPGVPSVYYGDETGMNGFTDPFNRAPFTMGNVPLVDWYKQLAALRNAHPALSTGSMAVCAPNSDVVLVLRMITDGTDALGLPAENGCYLLAVNRSQQAVTVDIDLAETCIGFTAKEECAFALLHCTNAICAITGEAAQISDTHFTAQLAGQSVHLYQLT